MRLKTVLTGVVITALTAAGAYAGNGKAAADAAADEIITMRSALAKAFIKPDAVITEEIFRKVCGATGKRVKELTESGLEIRHAAIKYRNPKNAANPAEEELIVKFEKDAGLKAVEREFVRNGKRHYSIIRPVYVEEACLACHGQKDKRPSFIVEKYPDDRAYGFNVGDIRGIITVTTPLD